MIYTASMSPTGNGSTVLPCFEHGNAIKMRNGILFYFQPGLPYVHNSNNGTAQGLLPRLLTLTFILDNNNYEQFLPAMS